MSTARLYAAALAAAPTGSKGRIYRAQMPGTGVVVGKGRIYRAQVLGTAAVAVTPPQDRAAGPGEIVTLTAVLASGGTADSWTWTRLSGPAVTLNGTGDTRTFTTPSIMPPSSTPLVLAINAVVGGVRSPDVTCTITILPQLSWTLNAAGTAWVGRRVVPA